MSEGEFGSSRNRYITFAGLPHRMGKISLLHHSPWRGGSPCRGVRFATPEECWLLSAPTGKDFVSLAALGGFRTERNSDGCKAPVPLRLLVVPESCEGSFV